MAYPYEGFFGAMDTIKDRQRLESLHESGQAPWRCFPVDGLPTALVPADTRAEAVAG